MVAEQIRVGVVGAGANTRAKHIPGLQAIEGVQVVAVCNRSRESGEQVREDFGLERVHDDWESLVQAPDIDAVVIGTWPYMHCPVTLAALASGKHVMCEARMAMNAREARQMVEAARQHPGLVVQVVPSPFSLHADRTIARLLSDGYVGQLLTVRICDHRGAFPNPETPMHWREDPSKSGVNMLSLGIWYEAMMRWVGPATTVSAFGKTFVPERTDPETGARKTLTIPDYLEVSADLACGAAAQFSLSAAAGLAPQRGAWLIGTDGTLSFAGGPVSGGRRGAGGLKPVEVLAGEEQGWRVEEEFINAIRGVEPITLTPFETGLQYMAFTEAVADSITCRKAMDIAPYLGGLLG